MLLCAYTEDNGRSFSRPENRKLRLLLLLFTLHITIPYITISYVQQFACRIYGIFVMHVYLFNSVCVGFTAYLLSEECDIFDHFLCGIYGLPVIQSMYFVCWAHSLPVVYQYVLFVGFTKYLLSEECDIFDPVHSDICQDMTHPLSHYFIAASHKTYAYM